MIMEFSQFGQRITGQSMFRILAEAKELERQGQQLIHLEIGDTYLEMPLVVKQKAVQALYKNHTHYGSSQGELPLRQAIQKTFREDYGFLPDLDQIVVTTGANPLIFYILFATVNPGEEVILPDPSFVTYNSVIKMLGLKGIYVPVSHQDNFRFSPKEITKCITKKTRVIVINSPSNPTGAVYLKKDVAGIFRLAKKHNLLIISDEIYSPFVYENNHFSAGRLDRCRKQVIVTSGFSKPFAMTGWRVGYGVGPVALMEKVNLLSQTIISCVPPFLQDACVTALQKRKQLVKPYQREYARLRNIIFRELAKFSQLEFHPPQGAFYLFVNVAKTGMDGDEFARRAMKEGVVVCPGSGFGANGKNYIRICYANTPVKLQEGCRRLARVINKKK